MQNPNKMEINLKMKDKKLIELFRTQTGISVSYFNSIGAATKATLRR
jgi:hypothetical protein